jgi:hypothetical protein
MYRTRDTKISNWTIRSDTFWDKRDERYEHREILFSSNDDIEISVSNSISTNFRHQTIKRKNMIRKIFFKRIRKIINVNNAFHIYNVIVVKDFYRIDVNDLFMNELNDDEKFDDDVEKSNNEKCSNNHSIHDLNRDLNINSKSIDESRDVASSKNVKRRKFYLHRIKLLTQNDFNSKCHSSWSTIMR